MLTKDQQAMVRYLVRRATDFQNRQSGASAERGRLMLARDEIAVTKSRLENAWKYGLPEATSGQVEALDARIRAINSEIADIDGDFEIVRPETSAVYELAKRLCDRLREDGYNVDPFGRLTTDRYGSLLGDGPAVPAQDSRVTQFGGRTS